MGAVLSTTGKIAKGQHVSEWVPLEGGRWVHKYSILGTSFVDYVVWEPCRNEYRDGGAHTHNTITFHDGEALGDVCTRDLPAELEALRPSSDERIRAVSAWYRANEDEARAIVLAAFPADFAA
jgi:hypothetical protein